MDFNSWRYPSSRFLLRRYYATRFHYPKEFVAVPENPMNQTASEEINMLGPDYFGFYTNEIKRLLSQDDGVLPYAHQVFSSAGNLRGVGRQMGTNKNRCQIKENNDIIGSASLSSNEIGAMLSESKNERLKSLLWQSVVTLTKEIDEMVNPVLNVCRISSLLTCKESRLEKDAITRKADTLKHRDGKLKDSSDCLGKARNAKNATSDVEADKDDIEIDDDLRLILESDSNKVEELLRSHTSEISEMLNHMEKNLQALLNMVMSTCRAMTIAEKQQLCKLIHKLPRKNLDRVAEIMRLDKPFEHNSSNKPIDDLDQLDNVSLWRLHFYVATVTAASTK